MKKMPLVVGVVAFLLLEVVAYLFTSSLNQHDLQQYANDQAKDLQTSVTQIVSSLDTTSQIIFDTAIDNDRIKNIIYRAAHTSSKEQITHLHNELFDLCEQKYEYFKRFGLRQLHFHLPGSISFLRMHRPDKYGDSLVGVRPTIDQVNRTKKVVRAFEEGRIFNGFRNVYPLYYHKEFIGSVEASFSFDAVMKSLYASQPASTYLFLLKKDTVQSKVFQDERSNYVSSNIAGYVIDKGTVDQNGTFLLDDFLGINQKIQHKIDAPIQKAQPFALKCYCFKTKRDILVSFVPVKNLAGEVAAYVVEYKYDELLENIERRFSQIFAFITLFDFVLVLLIGTFITVQHTKTQQATHSATHDPLTALYNRRGFDELFAVLFSSAKRHNNDLSIIFFDIDHFKKVNDTYGHDTGDVVLKQLASSIEENLRKEDIFARWGGEEFIILLPNLNLKQTLQVAKKLQEKIRALHFEFGSVTCSFGVTQCTPLDTTEEVCIKRVDELLYKAKESGRDRIEY